MMGQFPQQIIGPEMKWVISLFENILKVRRVKGQRGYYLQSTQAVRCHNRKMDKSNVPKVRAYYSAFDHQIRKIFHERSFEKMIIDFDNL